LVEECEMSDVEAMGKGEEGEFIRLVEIAIKEDS
jgi:hypothetical protein